MTLSELPAVNASLNATSAFLLTVGYLAIRARQVTIHRACMVAAFGVSLAFLGCYLYYHLHFGSKHFPGHGALRSVYLSILLTHTVLAAAVPFLAGTSLLLALLGRFERHRAIARWALPIWFYVSVTGVVIYWMLYRMPT